MDFFVEEMVERKRTAVHVLAVLGLSLGCVALMLIAFLFVMPMFPGISSILFMVVAFVFYLAYKLAVSMNVEFEYSMVNSEIDVDKIINRNGRKRLTTVNVKKLDDFGKTADSRTFSKHTSDVSLKKIYACHDKQSDDNYFLVYTDGSIRTLLVFSPSEKIIDMIEKLNPRRY